ncbi:MAG TPA: YicC/YloC family endoribonuclease [Planctomycetota bacterium]|nr:YicC/YloC family endoribonuclease [Planctomycetota bacterium]
MPIATKARPTSAPANAPSTSAGGIVRSMTGYGRAMVEEGHRVTAEIRAVNGRFLKLGVKVPGRYGAFEDKIKTLLNDHGIKRGSIDVALFFDDGSEDESAYGINEVAVREYVKQARAVAKKNKLKGDVAIGSLLPLPGVVQRQQRADDIDAAWTLGKKALEQAIAQFNTMRAREGAAMVADLREQLRGLSSHLVEIERAAPEALKAGVAKFKERIQRLLDEHKVQAPLNPDVIEREVVLMTDRTDVSEEMARLKSHFEQMEATLAAGGEVGKKLDFLTQELFREVNTIGSKTNENAITHRVVEMKGLIEKIREQVQNLE